MIHRRSLALVIVAALGVTAYAQPARHEIDNVAAFARLYGVVRYFYPGDASAGVDWDVFATHGVAQVRKAADARAVETTLENLFASVAPEVEIGTTLSEAPPQGPPDRSLIAWRYLGPGITSGPGVYRGKRTNRALVTVSTIDGFASIMQTLPAEPLRGRKIRLRSRVRARPQDRSGAAALWLRVDLLDAKMGFFDNMDDRPIRQPEWREYSIEGPVAQDAASVAIGFMASGGVTADFDALTLEVQDSNGGWTPVAIKDAGFEAELSSLDWSRVGSSKTALITRATEDAPEGRQYLRIAPPSVPPVTSELMDDVPPLQGRHAEVDLGSGLRARVPLSLADSAASATPEGNAALRSRLAALPTPGREPDVDTRLADVVVAWNVFRHFYPYWTEADVDWDARLRPLLTLASSAATRDAHRDAMRQLVADVRDGHGNVDDPVRGTQRRSLALRFALVEGQVAVTASNATGVPVGSVIESIDGVPAMKRIMDAMALASGSRQWKETRALQEVASCDMGSRVDLVVVDSSGSRTASLPCDAASPPAERRPGPISEVSPGIWYVDLSRATVATIMPKIEMLAKATGVVFDLRGYPTDAGARILPYLVSGPEMDRWMHIARIVGPFHQVHDWYSVGWNVGPLSPRIAGKVVFLTDGRAISYAESVMGYVKDRKLGTIIGSPTAGANGNVIRFQVPGGFTITFTGMRVTRHDGTTPHHLHGVQPDIPTTPTLGGLRSHRDEVLERGVALVKEAAKGAR